MRTTALIVAAGRGERLGGGVPKQFQPCAGRPLVAHALDRFCRSGEVEDVILVLPAAADLDRHLGGAGAWPLPVRAVQGGARRQASVAAGLAALEHDGLVLVHDGVRPLITTPLIARVRRAAAAAGAAVPACPCVETIKEVSGGRVQATLDRGRLVRAQTPQGFRVPLLREAHARAEADGVQGTDDAALVERLGAAVAVVDGGPDNIKVTGPADLRLAALLLEGGEG